MPPFKCRLVKSGQRKTLVQGGNFGHYLLGHLIFVHSGTLFAAPMDLKRLELTGPASPVIDDAAPHANNGFSELDFTPSGTFVYVAGPTATAQRSLYWLEASGNPKLLPAPPADHRGPVLLRTALALPSESSKPVAKTLRYTNGYRTG